MKKGRNGKIILIIAGMIILSPAITEAAFSGAISYSYDIFVLKGGSRSKTSNFHQSYTISRNGLLLNNKNIGNYSFGFGYANAKSRSSSISSSRWRDLYDHRENSSDNYTYNVSSGIFPATFTPITFSFSKHTTELDNNLNPNARGTEFKATSETNSYSATWRLISRRKLPTMTSFFNLTDTESDSQYDRRDERRRRARFDLTKGGLRTKYRLNYNYEDFLSRDNGGDTKSRIESHAVGMNFKRQMGRRMTLNGSGSYNNTEEGENFNLAAFFSRRHSRKLNSSYNYNFSRIDSRKNDNGLNINNRIAANVRYKPTSKLSANANSSYSNHESANSLSLNLGATYRITERWSSSAHSSLNLTRNGVNDLYSHSDGINTSYSKPFKHVNVNSSYAYSFSWRESDNLSLFKRVVGKSNTNSFSMGFASRTLKVVSLSSNFRFSRTSSQSDGKSSDSEGSSVGLGISSGYIKRIGISSSFGYSNTLTDGRRDQTINTGVKLTLSVIKYVSFALGYGYSRFMPSDGTATEVHTFSVSSAASSGVPFIYTKRITRHLTFQLAANYDVSHISSLETVSSLSQKLRLGPKLIYKIGKLTFSVEYTFNEAKTNPISGPGTKTYNGYYNTLFKLTRRF